MLDNKARYIDFASNLTFFEFIQNEFRPAGIDIEGLSNVIEKLQSKLDWDIASLSTFIRENPQSLFIFQNMFQLLRFTDAQMIHFMFDVSKLNESNLESVFEYAILNLNYDHQFQEFFLDEMHDRINLSTTINEVFKDRTKFPVQSVVAVFKMCIPLYVESMLKDVQVAAARLKKPEFADCAVRIANYMVNVLGLNEMLKSVNLKEFLKNKKVPRDTKGLHGSYLKLRVIQTLEEHGYVNIDERLKKAGITVLPKDLRSLLKDYDFGKKTYCTEKSVQGIVKSINGREKKFDLIIIVDGKPKHLFELNFYTTEGTKIGINEEEYIELSKFISENSEYQFHWITDGNYWLTRNGEERLKNLWNKLGEIYNLNTFKKYLEKFC